MKKARVRYLFGMFLVLTGICMIVFSVWYLYRYRGNTMDMEDNAKELLRELNRVIPTSPVMQEDPAYKDADSMPAVEIKGISCIGKLKVPALGLELPVANSGSDIGFTPIHISGTPNSTDFVIEALGYSSQFGKLSRLVLGDNIIFVDLYGYQYSYEITGIVSGTKSQLDAMDEAMHQNDESSAASLVEDGAEVEEKSDDDRSEPAILNLPGVETVIGEVSEPDEEVVEKQKPELLLKFRKGLMTYVRVAGIYTEEEKEDKKKAAG